MRRAVASALAGLLLLSGCASSPEKPTRPTALPDVTLPAFAAPAKATNLADLRGPLVINVWAQWCGPCRRDLPQYERFHSLHPDVAVLGVNWRESSHERAVTLLADKGVTYPSVVDRDGTVVRASALPTLILVDARGKIAYSAPVEIKSVAQLEKLVKQHLGVTP